MLSRLGKIHALTYLNTNTFNTDTNTDTRILLHSVFEIENTVSTFYFIFEYLKNTFTYTKYVQVILDFRYVSI